MTERYETKGHVWEQEDGRVDIFAHEDGHFCNGPRCAECGYGFCHHCDDEPAITCPGASIFKRLMRLVRKN